MKVKIFSAPNGNVTCIDSLEGRMNGWFAKNPNIEVKWTQQSQAAQGGEGSPVVISVYYTEKEVSANG